MSVSTDTNGLIKVLPPVEEILARERERKERTTLLMALLEDHLAKFHKMTDAKEIWEAIKLDLVEMMNQRRCRSIFYSNSLKASLYQQQAVELSATYHTYVGEVAGGVSWKWKE
ncbi:hypothetical protein Tco_0825620 [Tanacetum coccineum]